MVLNKNKFSSHFYVPNFKYCIWKQNKADGPKVMSFIKDY